MVVTGDLPPFIPPPPGPWVPPTQPHRHPVLAQLGGVLAFALATSLAAAAALFLILGLATSCGQPIDDGRTLLLKAGLGAVGALWAAVPAIVAHLSRRIHVGLMVPWVVVAVLAGLVTLVAVAQAEASPVFCF